MSVHSFVYMRDKEEVKVVVTSTDVQITIGDHTGEILWLVLSPGGRKSIELANMISDALAGAIRQAEMEAKYESSHR